MLIRKLAVLFVTASLVTIVFQTQCWVMTSDDSGTKECYLVMTLFKTAWTLTSVAFIDWHLEGLTNRDVLSGVFVCAEAMFVIVMGIHPWLKNQEFYILQYVAALVIIRSVRAITNRDLFTAPTPPMGPDLSFLYWVVGMIVTVIPTVIGIAAVCNIMTDNTAFTTYDFLRNSVPLNTSIAMLATVTVVISSVAIRDALLASSR